VQPVSGLLIVTEKEYVPSGPLALTSVTSANIFSSVSLLASSVTWVISGLDVGVAAAVRTATSGVGAVCAVGVGDVLVGSKGVGSGTGVNTGLGVAVKVGVWIVTAETGALGVVAVSDVPTGSEGVVQAPKSISTVIIETTRKIIFTACQVSL
jgi:hypothetical protein